MIVKRLSIELYVREGNVSTIWPHGGATTKAMNFPPFFKRYSSHRFSIARLIYLKLLF